MAGMVPLSMTRATTLEVTLGGRAAFVSLYLDACATAHGVKQAGCPRSFTVELLTKSAGEAQYLVHLLDLPLV